MSLWWVLMPFRDMWIGLTEVLVSCLAMPLERFYYRCNHLCFASNIFILTLTCVALSSWLSILCCADAFYSLLELFGVLCL